MRKELFVRSGGRPVKAVIRNYGTNDFDALIDVQKACFPLPFPEELLWNREQLSAHVTTFPQGAVCAEIGGRIVGSMTGLIVDTAHYKDDHSWASITDNGYIRNHNPNGNTLYVVDIAVMPDYRQSGIGKWMMQTLYETVVQLGLDRLLGGGRMPGYAERANEATPETYVAKVLTGEWNDPVISFLLRCGRMPVGIAANYLEDEQSLNHAVLMEWRNPFKS
ncbi:GNAT family N-acetyltransferase [Paenibacillus sp. LHD-117]|uniref:GNAT family N-acetyltransferase n=1 Tax=Paenibacillus sp. LHD-117 TaxID=3071412 RepID=UPI0027DF1199|nr:GNAT family N-acetyltransferase [Paenibacillus sp. LHD-117]MDQ6418082.1 GNAT family N-acetyltransferase [Paenibacillus sp. LHD-117]